MRRVTALLAVVVLSGLLLSACGSKSYSGGGGGGGTSSAAPVTLSGSVNAHGTTDLTSKGSAPTLALAVNDSYFQPTYVKAAPGATVSVTVKNSGSLLHNFSVDGQSVNVDLAPGSSHDVQVKIPASGGLRFYCQIHQALGMQGAFYTTEGVTVSSGTGSGGTGGTSGTPGY